MSKINVSGELTKNQVLKLFQKLDEIGLADEDVISWDIRLKENA